MSTLWLLLAVLGVLRLGELLAARRNAGRLLALGGREEAAGHYPLIVALHAAWFAALAMSIPAGTAPNPWLLATFLLFLLARAWVLSALGPFFTTRIITLPDTPLVRRGPYRFLRHPNYVVVLGEMAILPLVFGAWRIALAVTLLNLPLLSWRMLCEDRALDARRGLPEPGSMGLNQGHD